MDATDSKPKADTINGNAMGSVCPVLPPLASLNKKVRHLPHWTQESSIYWVTFRLTDSLPQDKLSLWSAERDRWLNRNPEPWTDQQWLEYNTRFGDQLDKWLDAGYGRRALAELPIREVVRDCLVRFEGDRLMVHAAVIMPNHVHMLFEPLGDNTLATLLKGMKGTSARLANKIMGKNGKFWLDESYDHIVRSERQYYHYKYYIKENPIRASLCPDEYWLHTKYVM